MLAPLIPFYIGERTADGRVDAAAVASEFGTGAWSGGSTPPPPTHFYVVGTAAQEQAFLGMLFAAHLADPRSLRGCAKLPLGGCGSAAASDHSGWRPLSPPELAEEEAGAAENDEL
ncbi:hypothetical protein EMIHUDRAFT_453592 [Emiliania huxleyi CCMP1516]|uniref:Uncharacterized protein n=2 Tax=Emiliania huxleyi TaxID=2903 RepID=A0A0D3I415_EMIH1|nr:hypothetical protein EMIHUDRAFT_453592 [Emiliania huxleyi CCMP1516]EOD06000.1 hypothetical protein EMIHUDRAFT_453592 [Emiliania huxleyi CCMP1516]|eukprot:XP_005758429.1 hypothetical protein EMIHUDRAFT_453592 [Emiliania huxleyi CCMP1516]